jgi:hypothetical protein
LSTTPERRNCRLNVEITQRCRSDALSSAARQVISLFTSRENSQAQHGRKHGRSGISIACQVALRTAQSNRRTDMATTVNPIQLQKYLKGLDYPVNKQQLLETAKKNGADENVISTLEQLPDKKYDAPVDVSEEVGKLK